MRAATLFAVVLGLWGGAAVAEPDLASSSRPVPRYESLKFDEVNARIGPSFDHPVAWTYRQAGVPVLVIMETDQWRKVRDPDGVESWVHKRTLSHRRTAMVRTRTDGVAPAYAAAPAGPVTAQVIPGRGADADNPPLAQVEPGVIVELGSCERGYCRVDHPALRRPAWISEAHLWGASPAGETSALYAAMALRAP